MNKLITLSILWVAIFNVGLQNAVSGPAYTGAATDLVYRIVGKKGETGDPSPSIARVENALSRYATACADHDDDEVANVLTRFAVVEYPAAATGLFVSTDAISAESCWASALVQRNDVAGSPIWIYPTNEVNHVLIQYTVTIVSNGVAQSVLDLALIEMDGDRIARIRDYVNPSLTLSHVINE